MFIQPGKLNIIIDGQFGSTGKGAISSYIGCKEHVDIAITNSSPNAGHTFYRDNRKYVTRHLPVSAIFNKRSVIYLCAGAIIDPDILIKEIDTFDITGDRLYVHPRATVISKEDVEFEKVGAVKKIASTMKGVGSALSRKINRESKLAKDHPFLKDYCNELHLQYLLDQDACMVMEVPQGFDLSINSGLSYPHCTSREITVSQALSDAQIHPSYLGNVMSCIRTFPIRVGNIVENGVEVGYSGPFYDDSVELSWKDIKVPEEYTTNTNRIRRVATFSMKQYERMMDSFRPTHVFLNFANYLPKRKLNKLIKDLKHVTHLGFGPSLDDIIEI